MHRSKRHVSRKTHRSNRRRHTRRTRHRGGAGLMGVLKEALVPFGLVAMNHSYSKKSKSRRTRRNGRTRRRR